MKTNKLALIIAAMALTSCGGSDSAMSSPGEALSGTWRGQLAFVEATGATCPANNPASTETHQISLNQTTVVLLDALGYRLEGALITDNSFDVKFETASAAVDFSKVVSYRNVSNGRADVILTTTDRSFDNTCVRKWSGAMMRG